MAVRPRRKTPLELSEFHDADVGAFQCVDGPILSGDGTIAEDLVCGFCHRTLFLALSRDGVFAEIGRRLGRPATDAHGRREPLLAVCDCGKVNRVWPPPVN